MDALRFVRGLRPPPPAAVAPPTPPPPPPTPQPRAALHSPLLRLWPHRGGEKANDRRCESEAEDERRQRNWVLQILRVQSWCAEDGGGGKETDAEADAVDGDGTGGDGDEQCTSCGGGGEEEACAVEEGEGEEFDRASFSRLLRKVSLAEAKAYSKMSYLCNIAYMIPKIKPKCLQRYNLQFVTSSVQEREKTESTDQQQEQKPGEGQSLDQETELVSNGVPGSKKEKECGQVVDPFAAYQIAASAASYLRSRAMGIIPFGSKNDGKNDLAISAANGEAVDEDSFVATTNSVTSMVAAKEETKQAVADDLNSSRSCPCEWFVCDDDQSDTRYFVVQGSESIASWQANLLFEPVKFEGFNVLVHRGIYEAAKGIYQQMLPYVKSHLRSHGRSATLQFTGHSLGGSLALLVNLMLLTRGEVPALSLLPVITFGAPCIMCRGDNLLLELGLPKNHVLSIMMHRDIVPRVFSCNYPDHVANILKLANGNFRSHPCLTNQKLLYAPMGEVLILQPDEKLSPYHHLLPPDSGLYHLGGSSDISLRVLQAAIYAFFNSPHPLDILKKGGAYGPKGSVYRDHDVNSYLRSVRAVLRKEMKHVKKAEDKQWRLLWWPFGVHGVLPHMNREQFNLVNAAVHGGTEALRQVQRHAHLLVVLLLPAKLLILGALSVIRLK